MPKTKELTTKQKRFVEAYNGNATKAALDAGYSPRSAAKIGVENMTKPEIIAAIKEREKDRLDSTIATREERQILWTAIARDTNEKTGDRLRATELLGKSEGDFLERHELTGKNGAPLTPEPFAIVTKFAYAIQRDDGTNINPDTSPEEYAAAWIIDFFAGGKIRADVVTWVKEFEAGQYGNAQGVKISEIVADYLKSRQEA